MLLLLLVFMFLAAVAMEEAAVVLVEVAKSFVRGRGDLVFQHGGERRGLLG